MKDPERIMLPRLGRHISAWGHGHTCDSSQPHDDPCVCSCGVMQPYDPVPHPDEIGWRYDRDAVPQDREG